MLIHYIILPFKIKEFKILKKDSINNLNNQDTFLLYIITSTNKIIYKIICRLKSHLCKENKTKTEGPKEDLITKYRNKDMFIIIHSEYKIAVAVLQLRNKAYLFNKNKRKKHNPAFYSQLKHQANGEESWPLCNEAEQQ